MPCTWACCVACSGEIAILCGYETGTFWDSRALAGMSDVSRHVLEMIESRPLARKLLQTRTLRCPRRRDTDRSFAKGSSHAA
jgi:hypothetical protein